MILAVEKGQKGREIDRMVEELGRCRLVFEPGY
jgi:hypothetical protein